MTLLRRIKVDSRRGERELERLVRRSRNVINTKTLRQARRIVNDVRRSSGTIARTRIVTNAVSFTVTPVRAAPAGSASP